MLQRWKPIFVVSAAMIAVHLLTILTGGYLLKFGIQPREIGTALTIATAPWLHANFAHLGSNLAAFVVLGSLVLLQGVRYFAKASAIIIGLGGALVWLLGREATHIGASGWIFGLWTLVVALAWYDRSPRNILIALAVLFFYGGMVFGVLPTQGYISFESHLFGAIAGVVAASVLSKKRDVEILPPERARELKFWPDEKRQGTRR